MINELYGLSKTLNAHNIETYEWHREYNELPNVKKQSPCIRIWLDDDGLVYNFEGLTAGQASSIRKYGNNQSSFPAFNINLLYRVTDAVVIKKISEFEKGLSTPSIDEISSWCVDDNWAPSAIKQMKRNLIDYPTKLLKLIGDTAPDSVIKKLATICSESYKDGTGFRESLEKCIMDKLKNKEDILLCLAMLFRKGSAEKEHNKDAVKLSVVLDVLNWKEYGNPVANVNTTKWLNSMLLKSNEAAQANSSPEDFKDFDAFNSPCNNSSKAVPMQKVKLSGLGEVTLRSMFSGQPCQYRYGKINDRSYPISPENRSSVKKALEEISSPSKEHINWEKTAEHEIAFVYPSKLPDIPLKCAFILGKNQAVNGIREKLRFERVSEDFIKTFRGLSPKYKPDNMQLFFIRKMDKARSKVIFTHNLTPQQLISGVEEWALGCGNLPRLETGKADTPFPLEIADIINGVWKQNGERADGKAPVKRMKYYQGMELLLNTLPQSALHNFLHVQLENGLGLIGYVGNKLHEDGHGNLKKDSKKDLKGLETNKVYAGQILSVIGLLLYKCNIRKENYMENFAYLLGQMLHVSDELHLLYCKAKRNGDIPPQLVGSSLFVTAGEMPYQAISQLALRCNPYIAWAKSYQYKKENEDENKDENKDEKEKKKEKDECEESLGLYQTLSDKLIAQMDKEARFNDFERAQLFIGYMSSPPKK